MKCYIKDFKTFQTTAMFDAVSYNLVHGDSGSVTIYKKDAVRISKDYSGMWLIANKELFYISQATPSNDSITLALKEPIYAFERPVLYNGSQTYGLVITDILESNFGINCPDSEYELSYLSVSNTDQTACYVEADEFGYVTPYKIFEDAERNGVKINFAFTTDELTVEVSTASDTTGVIVFGDGKSMLASESYSPDYVAKVTVIHRLEQEESYDEIDYYLSDDGQISTEPPLNRAKGVWAYLTANTEEDPLSVAETAFANNNENHKIEFYSYIKLDKNQPIKVRLRNEVLFTKIASVSLSSNDSRYYYVCGTLATTLSDKISNIEEKQSSTGIGSVGGSSGGSVNPYPIGSIYLSVDSTSPAQIFGGTWEQIKDRFLLSAGDTYAAGSTGGEASHTLTTTELPYNDIPSGNEAGGYGLAATSAFQNRPMVMQYGGGQAHNNMPPYLAVYIWKRIA